MVQEPTTVTERVGVIVAALYQGGKFSTAEAARLMCLTERGALYRLNDLARVIPLCFVEGLWFIHIPGKNWPY